MTDKLKLMQQLTTWYGHAPGQQLATFELYYLNRVLHELFGARVLCLGDIGGMGWFEGNAIRYPFRVSESGTGLASIPLIQAAYNDLPIQDSSVDIVLLPHVLDFETEPQAILQEVWRVLAPHGYAIILGFNPSSLWGLYRSLGLNRDTPPWGGHTHSIFHMRQYLNAADFDLQEVKTFFFRPPIHNKNVLSKLRFLEIMGQFFWAYGGGVYLLVTQKKVLGTTPLQLSWWERWTKAGQLWPEPVARCK